MYLSSVFRGGSYLSPILDMNTNEIISYDLSQKCQYGTDPENVGRRLYEVSLCRWPDLFYGSTRSDHKIIQSTGKEGQLLRQLHHGDAWTDENEMFYGHEKKVFLFETFAKAVDGYINYYNERIQNGCLLQNSERHPCAPNSIFLCVQNSGARRLALFFCNARDDLYRLRHAGRRARCFLFPARTGRQRGRGAAHHAQALHAPGAAPGPAGRSAFYKGPSQQILSCRTPWR